VSIAQVLGDVQALSREAASAAAVRQFDPSSAAGLWCRSVDEITYRRRSAMEWFKQSTSIAGTQIPNWVIVLAAIIVILLLYRNF